MTALQVAPSPLHGRGLFARRLFSAGEVVCSSPCVVVPPHEFDCVSDTVIGDYLFWWGREHGALCLGEVAMMNHSDTPNTRIEQVFDPPTLRAIALRDITTDEELTFAYKTIDWRIIKGGE